MQLVPISAKWRELGISLRIGSNFLDELVQSHEKDIIRLEHVLQKWLDLDSQQSLVNWKTIIDAVGGPLIENKALTKKLYEDLKQKASKQQSTITNINFNLLNFYQLFLTGSSQAKQHRVDAYIGPLKAGKLAFYINNLINSLLPYLNCYLSFTPEYNTN